MQSVLNDKSRLDYIICILSQYDLHCTELLCICIMLTQNITESCYKKFDANAGHQRSVEAKFLKIPKMFASWYLMRLMEKLEEFHNNNFGDTKCKVVKKLEYLIKYKILVNPL